MVPYAKEGEKPVLGTNCPNHDFTLASTLVIAFGFALRAGAVVRQPSALLLPLSEPSKPGRPRVECSHSREPLRVSDFGEMAYDPPRSVRLATQALS